MKTERIKVSVTQEDIDKGVRRHCTVCPIARAIQRLLKDEYLVHVVYSAHIYRKEDKARGKDFLSVLYLPLEVSQFIHGFDTGTNPRVNFKPFDFELVIDSAEQKEYFKSTTQEQPV